MTGTTLPQPLEREILDGARQRRRTHLYTGLTMVGLGLAIALVLFFVSGDKPMADRVLWACIFGLGIGITGAPFLVLAVVREPERAPLLLQLRARPASSIVWLRWLGPLARDRTQSATVSVGFDDGVLTHLTTLLPNANAIWVALCAYAPHATQGESEEIVARFRTAPQTLRAHAEP